MCPECNGNTLSNLHLIYMVMWLVHFKWEWPTGFGQRRWNIYFLSLLQVIKKKNPPFLTANKIKTQVYKNAEMLYLTSKFQGTTFCYPFASLKVNICQSQSLFVKILDRLLLFRDKLQQKRAYCQSSFLNGQSWRWCEVQNNKVSKASEKVSPGVPAS